MEVTELPKYFQKKLEKAIAEAKTVLDFSSIIPNSKKLSGIPESLVETLPQLEELILRGQNFSELPLWLRKMPNLKKVNLIENPLIRVLDNFSLVLDETTFRRLGNGLDHSAVVGLKLNLDSSFPRDIAKLEHLTDLEITGSNFKRFPREILCLGLLERLRITNTRLRQIPEEISELSHLLDLSLAKNRFTKFPKAILSLDGLEVLNLYGNKIKSIPPEIEELQWLTQLTLDNNAIKEIPESIGEIRELEWLGATENKLDRLPGSINRLRKLKTLSVGNNRFTKFPVEVLGLKVIERLYLGNLEILDEIGNNINDIPIDILKMKSLKSFNCDGESYKRPYRMDEGIKKVLLYYVLAPKMKSTRVANAKREVDMKDMKAFVSYAWEPESETATPGLAV